MIVTYFIYCRKKKKPQAKESCETIKVDIKENQQISVLKDGKDTHGQDTVQNIQNINVLRSLHGNYLKEEEVNGTENSVIKKLNASKTKRKKDKKEFDENSLY